MRCALVYSFFKKHNDYDKVLDENGTSMNAAYFDFSGPERDRLYNWALLKISDVVLYVGLLGYLLEITAKKEHVLLFSIIYGISI